jgi:hypothetical protein
MQRQISGISLSREGLVVTLTYRDLIELLRIVPTKRHPLEILGYEYSTRGALQFRQDCPDFLPQAYRLIEQSLAETGSFPRNPQPGVDWDGSMLLSGPDGRITFFSSAEISVFESIRTRFDFGSVQEAIYELLRKTADGTYLRVPPRTEL